jgi:hypothetical protein
MLLQMPNARAMRNDLQRPIAIIHHLEFARRRVTSTLPPDMVGNWHSDQTFCDALTVDEA